MNGHCVSFICVNKQNNLISEHSNYFYKNDIGLSVLNKSTFPMRVHFFYWDKLYMYIYIYTHINTDQLYMYIYIHKYIYMRCIYVHATNSAISTFLWSPTFLKLFFFFFFFLRTFLMTLHLLSPHPLPQLLYDPTSIYPTLFYPYSSHFELFFPKKMQMSNIMVFLPPSSFKMPNEYVDTIIIFLVLKDVYLFFSLFFFFFFFFFLFSSEQNCSD